MEFAGFPAGGFQFSLVQRIGDGACGEVQVAFAEEAQEVGAEVFPAAGVVGEEDGDDFFGESLQGEDRRVDGGDIGSQEASFFIGERHLQGLILGIRVQGSGVRDRRRLTVP